MRLADPRWVGCTARPCRPGERGNPFACRSTIVPSLSQIAAVLDQLSRGPQLVRELIYEMPPELHKRRPAPDVWSAHEHAVHLLPVHPIMVCRLEQMLCDPTLPIKSYEPSRDEPDDELLKLDLDTAMDQLARERLALVDRLRELTPDQWAITSPHEEYSHYSVYIMFRHLALHDLYHAYRIEERLLRKDWVSP